MRYTGGNIAALARRKCSRFTIHGQRHRAVENDVRCFRVVRVLRVKRVRPVLPDIRVFKSVALQFLYEFLFVHADNVTAFSERYSQSTVRYHALLKTATPFLRHWGMPPKGRTVFRREARYMFLLQTFSRQDPSCELSLETKARYPEAE